jgi:hypothetical protein
MAKDPFFLDVKKFADTFSEGAEDAVRTTALKLFSAIVDQSPVDEGRFRGAWVPTGAKPSTRVGGVDKKGTATIAEIIAITTLLKDWSTFTLTNNLPYANKIEFGLYPNPPKKGSWVKGKGKGKNRTKGHYEINTTNGFSDQAKNGVVRVNIARSNKLIEEEAKKRLPK